VKTPYSFFGYVSFIQAITENGMLQKILKKNGEKKFGFLWHIQLAFAILCPATFLFLKCLKNMV
jgi:hypothetical protein